VTQADDEEKGAYTRGVAPKGWRDLREYTDSLDPEEVPALRNVRELEGIYPLLHSLMGQSPADFFVRAAVLETLVSSGLATFPPPDMRRVLHWLSPPAMDTAVRSLSRAGWITFDHSAGWRVTDVGHWVNHILAFLHRQTSEGELRPWVEGLDYALSIGMDPLFPLQSLRSRLVGLVDAMERARASASVLVLKKAAAHIEEALSLSSKIREVLDQVPLNRAEALAIVREIHDHLSRLHGKSAQLHADIAEVGRQHLTLTGGLTTEEIVRALIAAPGGELAALGRRALLPTVTPPSLIGTEALAQAAEYHTLRERAPTEETRWNPPTDACRVSHSVDAPPEVLALLAELIEIAEISQERSLADFVPHGTPGESFLRASLLPLVGGRAGGEGVAGRLGSLRLEVFSHGDGWPERLTSGPLRGITPGVVRPREGNP
jgi:hypothetical protein